MSGGGSDVGTIRLRAAAACVPLRIRNSDLQRVFAGCPVLRRGPREGHQTYSQWWPEHRHALPPGHHEKCFGACAATQQSRGYLAVCSTGLRSPHRGAAHALQCSTLWCALPTWRPSAAGCSSATCWPAGMAPASAPPTSLRRTSRWCALPEHLVCLLDACMQRAWRGRQCIEL